MVFTMRLASTRASARRPSSDEERRASSPCRTAAMAATASASTGAGCASDRRRRHSAFARHVGREDQVASGRAGPTICHGIGGVGRLFDRADVRATWTRCGPPSRCRIPAGRRLLVVRGVVPTMFTTVPAGVVQVGRPLYQAGAEVKAGRRRLVAMRRTRRRRRWRRPRADPPISRTSRAATKCTSRCRGSWQTSTPESTSVRMSAWAPFMELVLVGRKTRVQSKITRG